MAVASCTAPLSGVESNSQSASKATPAHVDPAKSLVPTTGPPGSEQPDSTLPAEISPSAIAGSSSADLDSTPTALPPVQQKKPQYSLQASLDYDQRHVTVSQQITYTNPVTESLSDLVLMVDPLYYPGTFHLNRLAWGNGDEVMSPVIENGTIRLVLPAPLAPGQSIGMLIDFELFLPTPQPSPTTRPVPFGATDRQVNIVDWYPFIPPYRPGEGWLAHPAGFFGEHLVYDLADFSVDVQLTGGNSDLTIAAPATDNFNAGWHHYRLESARNFSWSVSHQYQVTQAVVNGTTIRSYAFPTHAEAAQAVLQTTTQALQLYNELFGVYPRPLLTVVEADFLDGMEYEGLYFLSNGFYNLYQGTPGEYLIAIAAHETCHQWWYARVGNDQALEPWLDEALCTYCERLFYERLQPQALDWWWQYRVNYYSPRGSVDGSIYNPLGYRAYRDAVYLNGAMFLEDLRKLIGDQAFFGFLQAYADQAAEQIATADTFFSILQQFTEQDLSPLLETYFESNPLLFNYIN
jgi:hypothetical protein